MDIAMPRAASPLELQVQDRITTAVDALLPIDGLAPAKMIESDCCSSNDYDKPPPR